MKDILSEANKIHDIKLLYKGKPAGDVTVETRFEVEAKAPLEQPNPKKGQLPRPQPAAISSNDDVLNFTFKRAEMKSDADIFKKMDPQAEIEFVGLPPQKGSLIYRSQAHQSGGIKPIWTDKYSMPVSIPSD
jgi:hypothetical protein